MQLVYMYVISLAIVYATGVVSTLFMGNGIQWFRKVRKPSFEPPEWLFGVVWPVLYTFQGIALVHIYQFKENQGTCLALFGTQLVLSMIWTLLFFRMKEFQIAFLDLISCLAINIPITLELFLVAPWWVGMMMTAYCLWLGYASLLNGWFVHNNTVPLI